MSRPSHPRAWWRTTVAEFADSGLSAEAFAAERGIHPGTLTWWRSTLARETTASADLVRVEVIDSRPAPTVVEARVGPAELRFVTGTDVAYVGALVVAIAKAAAC